MMMYIDKENVNEGEDIQSKTHSLDPPLMKVTVNQNALIGGGKKIIGTWR